MQKVTPEQMDEILRYVKSDGQVKDAGFPDIKLNPYDYHDNGGELEFNVVIYETGIANRIEEVRNDESAVYAVVSEITDGSRSAFTLYFESFWGQAGLNINDIYGYYETEDEARKEMNNMENVIIA